MKKFNIKVGDRKFIVKAKDNIDAVRKLQDAKKKKLIDALGEGACSPVSADYEKEAKKLLESYDRADKTNDNKTLFARMIDNLENEVLNKEKEIKKFDDIWSDHKKEMLRNIRNAELVLSQAKNRLKAKDANSVRDAKTIGRYKSKSGKVYIIKEDTGYGSIGSYPYVTDDKGKWVPVPDEIRKGGFKALYELIHSGNIEKYITDSSIKDASPIIVEAIPYKNEMYVVLEFSWNGSKRWIVVAKENYHNEKKYTGGGVVEFSLNGAKKTADDFYTMNKLEKKHGRTEGYKKWMAGETDSAIEDFDKTLDPIPNIMKKQGKDSADKVNEIKDYGRDIAVPGTNIIAIGIEDLFDYIRWIKDSLSKGDKSRAERLAEDFKRLLSERKKSVAGLPQYTNTISKYVQEAEKEFNSIKM